jgi:hypothetical protein
VPRHGLHGEQRARHVDVEDTLVIGARDLGDRGGGEDGGVVDQDVDPPSAATVSATAASMLSCRVTSSSTAMAASPISAAVAGPIDVDIRMATRAPSRT